MRQTTPEVWGRQTVTLSKAIRQEKAWGGKTGPQRLRDAGHAGGWLCVTHLGVPSVCDMSECLLKQPTGVS